MSSRKRNEWLEADKSEDDEEEQGYDSEEQELSKTTRVVKRRRIQRDDDESESPSEAENLSDDDEPRANHNGNFDDEHDTNSDSEDAISDLGSDPETAPNVNSTSARSTSKLSKPSKLQQQSNPSQSGNSTKSISSKPAINPIKSKSAKTGVIYLSRVPPFMKPATVKQLLEPFGTVTRIFLTPEDRVAHTARVRAGGNKKRSFTDGWVEFARKKHAKLVAETLNAQIIGGKKGGYYHDDLWNIKYLRGFKWHHLTEQIANENAERGARMRTEIAEARKEDRRFVANVERAKMLDGMRRKREERGMSSAQQEDKGMQFMQHEVKVKDVKRKAAAAPSAEAQSVLSRIF